MLDAKVGCLGLTLFGSSGCSVGFTDALGFGYSRITRLHYYRLIYHCRHFHCRSDRSDYVILPPLVAMMARPPSNETGSSYFYH
jgi:hypothetical protein